MKGIIDETLEVPIGRKDGAVVLSMMKMPHLVDKRGMFPMMMDSLCISHILAQIWRQIRTGNCRNIEIYGELSVKECVCNYIFLEWINNTISVLFINIAEWVQRVRWELVITESNLSAARGLLQKHVGFV
jgi:hypothetical protein